MNPEQKPNPAKLRYDLNTMRHFFMPYGSNEGLLTDEQLRCVKLVDGMKDWNAYRETFLAAAELGHLILDTESQMFSKHVDTTVDPLRYITIGTLTGACYHFNVRKWLARASPPRSGTTCRRS